MVTPYLSGSSAKEPVSEMGHLNKALMNCFSLPTKREQQNLLALSFPTVHIEGSIYIRK